MFLIECKCFASSQPIDSNSFVKGQQVKSESNCPKTCTQAHLERKNVDVLIKQSSLVFNCNNIPQLLNCNNMSQHEIVKKRFSVILKTFQNKFIKQIYSIFPLKIRENPFNCFEGENQKIFSNFFVPTRVSCFSPKLQQFSD